MKICFVAGGSGGHITPALAVADYIREQYREAKIFFISSAKDLDAEIFANHGVAYRRETITTGKLRRYVSLENVMDLVRIPKGIWEAFQLLKKEQPDVIFSKGGYVALPVGIAAKFCGIPLVIHESDTVPGLANRVLQKFSRQTLTTFPGQTGVCVGTPVRSKIANGDAERGREFLGFGPKEKILLVMGGSQGSEAINRVVMHSLEGILPHACIAHLAGRGNVVAKDTPRYRSFPYLGSEYADVLAAADMVVSRAGANSLFEFAMAQKPILLIPLPSAANNHQYKNALFFARHHAARVMDQENLTSAEFQRVVLDILGNTDMRQSLSHNISSLATHDASEQIANILWGYGDEAQVV